MARFLVEPKIKGDLIAGTEGDGTLAYVGKIAEIGDAKRAEVIMSNRARVEHFMTAGASVK